MQETLVRIDLSTRPGISSGGLSEAEVLRPLCGPSLTIHARGVDADEIVIEGHLPNFAKSDVTIDVGQGFLLIQAELYEAEEATEYLISGSSSFYRSVRLPAGCQRTLITADFSAGLLQIRLPMTAELPGREVLSPRRQRSNLTSA